MSFTAGGRIRADGADLRVLNAAGQEVPHRLIIASRDRSCDLIFKVVGNDPVYYIYYGNPSARPPTQTFKPKAGLVLETRKIGDLSTENLQAARVWKTDGRIYQWPEMKNLIERSSEVMGRALWPKIELRHNPFGPSEWFMLVFEGYLHCPQDGQYSFAILADDPGAFIMEGRKSVSADKTKPTVSLEAPDDRILESDDHKTPREVVTYFMGGRSVDLTEPRITAAGSVVLKKGVHRVWYYQIVWGSQQIAALGWKLPKQRAYSVVPPEAFGALPRAAVENHEELDRPIVASFEAREANTYVIDGHSFIEYEFRALPPSPPPGVTYHWDFGNGVDTFTGGRLSHLFVLPGRHQVTLTARRSNDEVAEFPVTLDIHGALETAEDYEATVKRYAKLLAAYPHQKLSEPYSKAVIHFFEKVVRDRKELARALAGYVESHTPERTHVGGKYVYRYLARPSGKAIGRRQYHSLLNAMYPYHTRLAQCYTDDTLREYEKAFALNQDISERWSGFPIRAAALAANIEICLTHLKQPQRALAICEQLEKEADGALADWKWQGGKAAEAAEIRKWKKTAVIRAGNAYRQQGQLERAKELYERAASLAKDKLPPAVRSMRRSSHERTVGSLIHRRWYPEARDAVWKWELEFPKERLRGLTDFYRGKSYVAARDCERGEAYLQLFLKFTKSKDKLADAWFLLGECELGRGSREKALQLYRKVVDEFPDRYVTEEAKLRLRTRTILRADCADDGDACLTEHTTCSTMTASVRHLSGWNGRFRIAHRWAYFAYTFPVPPDTPEVLLRFREYGPCLLEAEGTQLQRDGHVAYTEGVADREIPLKDSKLWSDGKIDLRFRDCHNRGRWLDVYDLWVDWIELHLLEHE